VPPLAQLAHAGGRDRDAVLVLLDLGRNPNFHSDYGTSIATYDLIADLPVEIDAYSLEGLELHVSDEFTRLTTLIRLAGGGHEGVGEDVTYEALDHVALQDAGATLPLAGSYTLRSFRAHIDSLDLWPAAPARDVSRLYRRWAYESAALDLALRQAGRSLADALGREPRPVVFVMSKRLLDPTSTADLRRWLETYPTLSFKLDPTPEWTEDVIAELREMGVVDSLDLKGHYSGTVVDNPPDADRYRLLAETFPDAWLEDPALTPETDPVLEPHRDRITWDAPIHSIADIESLPFPPKMVNVKPSRFGGLPELFGAYDYCDERGIRAYGGGQYELGAGRGHIQYLASLFHPDTPNDVAPSGYNDPSVPPGLPESPLAPQIAATGFRWGA
jgi:L-alanine-DL-glutamate epimerase-like enolase superfamily enzyme